MRRRIDRPPKRIVLFGAYLLLVPQIHLLAFVFVLIVVSIANGGRRWSYQIFDETNTIIPDALAYECVKSLIVLALLWLYSAILFKMTRRAIWSRHQRRSLRANHCPHCGYDLRASKDRCPECGAPISATS